MRNIYFALLILLASCQNSDVSETKSGLPDSIAQASPDNIKRIMDSILKANPGAKISMEVPESTNMDSSETKDLHGSDLKIINEKILDSLLKISSKKYTLVHFWATWCAPCRKEFPKLIEETNGLKEADVLLVSSDYDSEEMRKKVLAVYKKLGTDLPVFINEILNRNDAMGLESQKTLIKHYGLSSDGGLPFNLLIENKTKKIVSSSGNYHEILAILKKSN